MREIKFRAWDKKNKKMHYDVQLSDDFWAILYPQGYYVYWEIAGQYTGLKDKNGEEIYEGDIVEDSESDDCSVVKGVVIFKEGCFWVQDYENEDRYFLYPMANNIEVIGNIYEHKYLLEENNVQSKR